MVSTKWRWTATFGKSQKADLSSDWSLQLDSMKLESLVIADQHAAVNTFPGLVHTACHAMGAGIAWKGLSNLHKEESLYGDTDNWGEVITRQL